MKKLRTNFSVFLIIGIIAVAAVMLMAGYAVAKYIYNGENDALYVAESF